MAESSERCLEEPLSVKNPVPTGELSKSGASRGGSLIFVYMTL